MPPPCRAISAYGHARHLHLVLLRTPAGEREEQDQLSQVLQRGSPPGVGEVIAQAIVDYRTENGPFTSVDQLLDVSGIGDATLENIRDLVTV